MPASAKRIQTWEITPRNADVTGKNLVLELHEVTYAADATVEVATNLTSIIGVLSGVAQDVSAPAANILGCDKIITTGAVTIAATASNSDTFFVVLMGYV